MSGTDISRKQGRRHPPMASHRLFPWACGLWFATLFMLCSLVVPVALLERGVVAMGLDRVFAAAAPPLGETSRLLIAVGLSTVGEIVGLIFGRLLAARARQGKTAPASFVSEPAASVDRPPLDMEMLDDLGPPPTVVPTAVAAPSSEPLPDAAPPTPGPFLASADLDELGIVQLSERLAMALQARREHLAHLAEEGEAGEGGAPLILHPRHSAGYDRSPEAVRLRPEALAALRKVAGIH